MIKPSHRDFVVTQLNQTHIISRNMCLKNYITRLGALIWDLKQDGYEFTTYWEENIKPDGSKGKDFIYKVTKFPWEQPKDTTQKMF